MTLWEKFAIPLSSPLYMTSCTVPIPPTLHLVYSPWRARAPKRGVKHVFANLQLQILRRADANSLIKWPRDGSVLHFFLPIIIQKASSKKDAFIKYNVNEFAKNVREEIL